MRASFTIAKIEPVKVFIADNDIGMSVTNDAEAVVESLNQSHPRARIIYRDTEGSWGELVHVNGVFKDFAPYNGDDVPKT